MHAQMMYTIYMHEYDEVNFIENRLVRVIGSSSGSCRHDA